MNILIWLIATILGSCAYRLGGASKTGEWYDFMCRTKTRDLGVSSVGILYLLSVSNIYTISFLCWICYLLTFGLMFGALTTYFKKGQDAKAWNWMLVGLAQGLALAPYAFITGHWIGFAIRTVFLVITITVWSEWQGNVVWEECGRGALIITSLKFLI